MLVSEMRRQEATYFLMNWETRGSEQGLTEEWPTGLCGWPGSGAEGQYPLISSQLTSHQDPPHFPYSPRPQGLSCHPDWPGDGVLQCGPHPTSQWATHRLNGTSTWRQMPLCKVWPRTQLGKIKAEQWDLLHPCSTPSALHVT